MSGEPEIVWTAHAKATIRVSVNKNDERPVQIQIYEPNYMNYITCRIEDMRVLGRLIDSMILVLDKEKPQ